MEISRTKRADNLWLNLKHYFTANFAMLLEYQLERHGEGNVNKPHPSGAPDDDEWEFLSGVTESTSSLSLALAFSYTSVGKYFTNGEYTYSRIKNARSNARLRLNAENQPGVNRTTQQFILRGSYRF